METNTSHRGTLMPYCATQRAPRDGEVPFIRLGFMNTPTLGYQDDSNLRKVEIARIQLTEAINLFVSEKFLCALTLAGAAEEILGRLALMEGQSSAIQASAAKILELKDKLGLTALISVTEKSLFQSWNAARNTVKHHDKSDPDSVVINSCDEAYWMIRRALANANLVKLEIDNAQDFENWVIVNVNL